MAAKTAQPLHFEVSSGLKRVLGSELIADEQVALFELVKNSFDASAQRVVILFEPERIIVADDGDGMSYDDIKKKWLFVAYSSKRAEAEESTAKGFRDTAAERPRLAGSKGIGRF